MGYGDLYGSARAEDHAPQGRQGQEDRMMKILGWVGDGDLYGSDRAEDHAPKADRVKMKILGWVGDGDLYGSDRAEDHAPKVDRVKKIGASGWVVVTEGRVSSPVYIPQGR